MILNGGQNIHGIPIGVLCLESYYGKIPGHIKNATTFNFPITYKVVKGATPANVVKNEGKDLIGPFIKAAKELEKEGVQAITGSCGFLTIFQKELADCVDIPVYASSLIQVPMIHRMLKPSQKIGLLVACKESFTRRHLLSVGAESVPVCIAGMDRQPEFCDVIIDRKREELDIQQLENEVLTVVGELADNNSDMGALVIECTDLPPFAHLIQQRIGIPVFDIITLTNMVYQAVVRNGYKGYMPKEGNGAFNRF